MRKIYFLAVLLLAGAVGTTSCKKKEKESPKYTNSYTLKGGAETPIKWGAFYYNQGSDLYTIGLCKRIPDGEFGDESEGIQLDFRSEKLNQKITIGGAVTAEFEWGISIMYNDPFWYLLLASSSNAYNNLAGWFKVSRTGTSNVFTIDFDLTFNDKHAVGNYRGSLIEKNEYFGYY